MRRRWAIGCVLVGCAGLLAVPFALYGLWYAASAGSSSGLPALAAEWRDHLARFPDPDAARAADPDVIVMRFENGEWAFGRTQDSHGIWRRGGGTVVIRDSTGRTRAFFGHVCGAGRGGISYPLEGELPSLAEFDKRLAACGFVEHPLGERPRD